MWTLKFKIQYHLYSHKRKKNLDVNLTKHAKALNPKNYKMLMKEIKSGLHKQGDTPCSQIGRRDTGTITYRYLLQINIQTLYNSYQEFVSTLTRLFQNFYGCKETRIAKTVFFFFLKKKVEEMSCPISRLK